MKIGIVAQNHGEFFGVHQDLVNLAEEFGSPVVISPLSTNDFHSCYNLDALILPGGADIEPRRYSFLPSLHNYSSNSFLEHFDTAILPTLVTEIPIFGICRGMQTLNVQFGGTLHRHLYRHVIGKDPYKPAHDVTMELTHTGKFQVNSSHHQAVNKLGAGLQVLARAYDNTIEAIQHQTLPIGGVQWHPERLRDSYSLDFIRRLFNR